MASCGGQNICVEAAGPLFRLVGTLFRQGLCQRDGSVWVLSVYYLCPGRPGGAEGGSSSAGSKQARAAGVEGMEEGGGGAIATT